MRRPDEMHDFPIVDAHHHLYARPGVRYLDDDFLADVRTVPGVKATIFVQARAFYRKEQPEAFRPVGETDFAARVAELSARRDGPKLCAGIVGFADLLLGDCVEPVLQAHVEAGRGYFRGIRHILAWDRDASLLNPAYPTSEDMMDSDAFLHGFARLGRFGLSFDAWVLFPQLPRLAKLARRFPETRIIINHCGGVLGSGAYAGRRHELFTAWRQAVSELAPLSNVSMKIGGLGMALSGFGLTRSSDGSDAETLAHLFRPYVMTCVDLFGAGRCMCESNFPADREAYDYATYWKAMALLTSALSPSEKMSLFGRTAANVYRLS